MATKSIPIKDICLTGGTQQRSLDDDVVKRYAALMKDGFEFPPVEITIDGKNNFLTDGFHRVAAARKNGKTYIKAFVVEGTRREAIFLSFSANIKNAFPRQRGTVKGIIEKILKDEEWAKMSQSAIALYVGCTQQYVNKIINKTTSIPQPGCEIESGSKPNKEVLPRPKTVKVKRGDSEYEQTVPEKKEKPVLDATGEQVPEHLVEYFKRANEIREPIRALNAMLKVVKDCKDAGDKFYAYIKIEILTQEIGNVKRVFRFGLPYAVCGYCGGDVNNEYCRACGGYGFVNEMIHRATLEEFK